jgi:hypothetical protein
MAFGYRHDFEAFNRLVLNAPWMEAAMRERAELVKAQAEATAPVDEGDFAAAFEVESGTHGSITHDRAYATVRNTDPAAEHIEFGTSDTPAHYTLMRAVDVIR